MTTELTNGVHKTSFPLEELSAKISKNAGIVTQHLATNHLPQPSFNDDGPSVILPTGSPQEVLAARQDLIGASLELLQLAIGPSEFLPNLAIGYQYISCLQWLCQFKIFHLVPLNGTIAYGDLAAAARVPEQRLKSIIRMAITNALFREQPDRCHVGHSATSAFLAKEADVYAYATYMCSRSAPMAICMTDAHQRWGPDTTRTYETAYNIAFHTDLPFFDHIGRNEDQMGDFARYMRSVRSSEGVHIKHLLAGYTWQNIREGGMVVDVGGSTGTSAIALAKEFSHLNFTVQDLPANAESGRKAAAESLTADVASRITFQGHNFTNPQPVQGADAYLLRMILHDWPDNDAVQILKNIVPAMEKGKTRLLIMDTVLPHSGSVPNSVERISRARDLTMIQAFNSKERDLDDWNNLIALTSPQLKLVNVVQPFGSAMSVLEISLEE